MAALTAGSAGDTDLGHLAALVVASVLVVWFAHVYAHGLSESIARGRRVDSRELATLARGGAADPLAAGAPCHVARARRRRGVSHRHGRVAGPRALSRDARGWRVRYARIEARALATCVVVVLNLGSGLLVVALKVLVAH